MQKSDHPRDTIALGLLFGLGSMLAVALLLTLGLFLFDQPLDGHLRWYAACFVPPVLMLRHFFKNGQLTVAKTIIISLFLTFIAFMFLLFRTQSIQMQ